MKASKLAKELEKLVYYEGDFDVFVKQDPENEDVIGVCFHIATLEEEGDAVGYLLLTQQDSEGLGVEDNGIYEQ